VNSVAFSNDGKLFASAGLNKTIKIWSFESYKEVKTLLGHNNYVSSVSFSADSKYLASGSWD
jgi:WD40 repeat protein